MPDGGAPARPVPPARPGAESPQLFVANVTPFTRSGQVDLETLRRHTSWLAAHGVHGFAPTGTTGEFLYLRPVERMAVHRAVIEAAGTTRSGRRRKVVPCVFDPDPAVVAQLARHAQEHGAWAVFLPPPIYQPVGADAICAWYRLVLAAVEIPVLGYHHPRVHNDISVALYRRLRDEVGLAGIKDSSGDAARVRRLAQVQPDTVWAGGDLLLGLGQALGPVAGHISRFANLYPGLALRALQAEGAAEVAQVRAEIADRAARLSAAGGLAALKVRLGMGCRAPVTGADEAAVAELPAPAQWDCPLV